MKVRRVTTGHSAQGQATFNQNQLSQRCTTYTDRATEIAACILSEDHG